MLKYSQVIDIDFLGVWDTVGALGLPFGNLPILGKKDMQFLNTGCPTLLTWGRCTKGPNRSGNGVREGKDSLCC